jgi:hypothetical protein
VIILHNKHDSIAEVITRNGELQCLLEERMDCIYIGFVYSLPLVYGILE